jgi:hypothetical protein
MTALTIETIKSLMSLARSSDIKPDNGNYYVTISSRSLAILVMIGAKARWKAEYRRQRMEAKGLTGQVTVGNLGAWQGFTFKSVN